MLKVRGDQPKDLKIEAERKQITTGGIKRKILNRTVNLTSKVVLKI
jgi:hypothetical protein